MKNDRYLILKNPYRIHSYSGLTINGPMRLLIIEKTLPEYLYDDIKTNIWENKKSILTNMGLFIKCRVDFGKCIGKEV